MPPCLFSGLCAWALCQARAGSPAALPSRAPTAVFQAVCNKLRPLACLRHARPGAFFSARPDGHRLQHDRREPAVLTPCVNGRPLPEAALPTDESSTWATFKSLALKSRPWCLCSTLPGQIISCISPTAKMKSLGPTSSRPSCLLRPNLYTSLSKSSQHCLTWLASCFRHSPVQPLARHQLQALAAADACAEDDLVGIGGLQARTLTSCSRPPGRCNSSCN